MLCPNCEAENRDDAKFCDDCGFPLSGAIARVAGAASPAEPRTQRRARAAAGAPASDSAARQAVLAQDQAASASPSGSQNAPEASAPQQQAYAAPATSEAPLPEGETFEVSGADFSGDQFKAPSVGYPSETVDDELFSEPDFGNAPGDSDAIGAEGVPAQPEDDAFAGYSIAGEDDFGYDYAAEQAAPQQPVQPEAPEEPWNPNSTMQMPNVERPGAPRSRDFRISNGSGRRAGGRKGIAIGAGIAVGVILAVLITYLLGIWGGTAIPDVKGMTETDARAALEQSGFTVRSTQVKSDDTEGLVIVMDPSAGSRAAEGSEVVIHIATARYIPDVAGKLEAEARSMLEGAGYENVRYEKEKSEGVEGLVLSVSPDVGTRAKSNAEVIVKVSEAYRVPDISGLDLASAGQLIADAGLTYGVAYIDSELYEDGTILGTNPEAGTQVEKDSYVSINVARQRGVELVALTQSMFGSGQTVEIGGVEYEIQSLDSVSYYGNDVVSYTITALPKTTFFGKTIYADAQVVSGQVAWSEDNEVISIY